jgi:hypothetical protein
MMHDVIYSLVIQNFSDDNVILILVSYRLSIISQEMLRELQCLKIENNVSILGVGRRDKENVSVRKRINMDNILI